MNAYQLKERIKHANQVDFSNVLDQSFRLFKKVWLKGFVMVLIIGLFTAGLNFVLKSLGWLNYYNDNIFEFSNIYTINYDNLLVTGFQSLVLGLITFPLMAGFYKTCQEMDLSDNDQDYLFYFFKSEYLPKVALLSIAYSLIAIIAQALFVLPYLYAFIPLSYFVVLFTFNPELSVGEIVELSFIFGTKKWLVSFGTVIIVALAAMVGVIACFIGVLFTICAVYLPYYIIYKEAIGLEENSEIDLIGSNL